MGDLERIEAALAKSASVEADDAVEVDGAVEKTAAEDSPTQLAEQKEQKEQK